MVDDADDSEEMGCDRTALNHRKHRRRHLARPARHRAFLRGARRRDLSVQIGGRGMGAVQNQGQLRRARML